VKGYQKNTYRAAFAMLLFVILFTSALSLSGCSQTYDSSVHAEAKHSLNRLKEAPGTSFLGDAIVPIQAKEEEFYKAAGWLSNTSILYITNHGEGSRLYSYNIGSGKGNMLYKSELPIITAEISPDKEKILIHSASANSGNLTIIQTDGEEYFTTEIESYELSFEWNPYNTDMVAVSAFTEDWDFNVYLLDLVEKQLKSIALPEPFVRWISADELVYQDWGEQSMSLQAPLKMISVSDGKTKKLFDNVYQVDTIGKFLITIKVDEIGDPETAQYTAYAPGLEFAASFNAPALTSFSGWLVPFYDVMKDGKGILYLRAQHKGEADIYQDGFDLMRLDVGSQKEDLIFSGLANEPLSCSPSGDMCLSGFQFEKVLNIATKEIIELVEY
jgi:hypothetical protein